MTALVSAENVCVTYGAIQALQGISLSLFPGHVVALVGPNGAGKTTLIRTLFGESQLAEGTVRIAGLNPFAPKDQRRLCSVARFVEDTPILYPELTVREQLEFVARAYAVPRSQAKADVVSRAMDFGIADQLDRRIKTLSLGTKQKIHVASGFFSGASGPRVLVLDEPTTGMDPPSRILLAEVLKRWVTQSETSRLVIISSHNLAELSSLADVAILMNTGEIVKSGLIRDIAAQSDLKLSYEITLFDERADILAETLKAALNIDAQILGNRSLKVTLEHSVSRVQELVCLLSQRDQPFSLRELRETFSPLERFYLQPPH
jgi:ABC-2 type transport system ATP-binding protein